MSPSPRRKSFIQPPSIGTLLHVEAVCAPHLTYDFTYTLPVDKTGVF